MIKTFSSFVRINSSRIMLLLPLPRRPCIYQISKHFRLFFCESNIMKILLSCLLDPSHSPHKITQRRSFQIFYLSSLKKSFRTRWKKKRDEQDELIWAQLKIGYKLKNPKILAFKLSVRSWGWRKTTVKLLTSSHNLNNIVLLVDCSTQ